LNLGLIQEDIFILLGVFCKNESHSAMGIATEKLIWYFYEYGKHGFG
jgi:hypothetical protein